ANAPGCRARSQIGALRALLCAEGDVAGLATGCAGTRRLARTHSVVGFVRPDHPQLPFWDGGRSTPHSAARCTNEVSGVCLPKRTCAVIRNLLSAIRAMAIVRHSHR